MRAKLAAGVLVIVAIAAAVFWFRSRTAIQPQSASASGKLAGTPAAHPGGRSETLQRRLYLDILHDGVTPGKAKQLFSLVFGDLPGITTRPEDHDPDDFCGTMAADYIRQVWGSLTEAERTAVRSVLAPSKAARTARLDEPHIIFAGFTPPPADTGKYDYEQMAKDADFAIAKRMNMLPPKIHVTVSLTMPKNGTAKAETTMWEDGTLKLIDGDCHITVFDPMFANLSADDALSIMSHEMWHCYQEQSMPDAKSWISVHGWIREGQADWVMATIWPAATVYVKDWTEYVTTPAKPFSDRNQDGLGIVGHLADVMGTDTGIWERLLPTVSLGIGGEDMAPFLNLTQGYRLPYVTSWGPSYFLTSGRQNWTMSGPGNVPSTGAASKDLFVPKGAAQLLEGVGWFQAQITKLSTDAEIVAVGLLSGYGRLHDESFGLDTQIVSGDVVIACLKPEGCACPDGSPGASLSTKPAKAPLYVGLEGADATAQAGVATASLDDFCKKPPEPPGPEPPGGGGGGGGGGDPDNPPQPHDGSWHGRDVHITTFDGLRYDFQVVGEYTLVRSTVDDFAIQVREVPALKSRTVSVSQATATKIGTRRVTVTLENGHMVLRVDGAPVTDARVLLGGGSIERSTSMYGDGFRIEWPDGTTARVDQEGMRLNTSVIPSEARRGKLAGLLGNDNGTPADDLVASGASLGTTPSPDDITHKFADAWRITQDTSLFDYAPGQSTATFTDPTFPDYHVDPTRVPDRATAEQRCRQSGVTDRRLLDDCVVDYGMTSDFLFVSAYRRDQQILAARAALPPPSPGVRRTVPMTGTIASPTSQASVLFTARAGDVLWIGNPDCTDNYMQGTLLTPSGKAIGGGAICARGRLVLPETGDYHLASSRTNNPAGAYSIPLRIVRPDRVDTTSYGSVVAGRIETRGAHDIYTFDGHAGDVLRVSGEGCDLGMLVISVVDAAGHDTLGPNCRAGNDYRLPRDGKFQFVINGADGGFGPYHFVLQGAASPPPK
jgi:hypothetical protein